LVVGPASELGQSDLVAHKVNWISGMPPTEPFEAEVKIRYRAEFEKAWVKPQPDQKAQVIFQHSLRDITPGQLAVFYNGEVVVGGGLIST